jgi:uncharacterized protein YfaS (alpha-2-macroglobulin family)
MAKMSLLNSLKIVTTKRPAPVSPIARRRDMLIAKLNEQVAYAQAQQDGSLYAPTRLRTVKDQETGESKRVEMPKRVKPWWFNDDSGKLCLVVKYGTKPLELAKGKVAIELTAQADLIPTLETLKAAVSAGELDAQIEVMSGTLRKGFAKK